MINLGLLAYINAPIGITRSAKGTKVRLVRISNTKATQVRIVYQIPLMIVLNSSISLFDFVLIYVLITVYLEVKSIIGL